MRIFLLRLSKGYTRPFKLNDLPGAGRIDLACRCITTAIFISEALRKNVEFRLVLEGPPEPPKTITFISQRLRRVYPDERNIASHINIALEKSMKMRKNERIESEAGIFIERTGFEKNVRELAEATQLIYLHPRGKDIQEFSFDKDVCFVLGDHRGLSKNNERFLKRMGAEVISLGKITYLASQVIAICHYELDRRGIE